MATKDRTALKDEFKNGNLATGERFADLIDSMKVVQEPVADPEASGTSLSFIASIEQNADGKVTATKKTLDLANAHEINPFKGWWKTGDTLPTSGFDGAYLYFKDTDQTPAVTTIFRWNGTGYADTGVEVDESNVQTFQTGQQLSGVAIDGTGLVNPAENALAKAGDVMPLAVKLEGVTASVVRVNESPVDSSYVKGSDGTIAQYNGMAYIEKAVGNAKSVRFLGVKVVSSTSSGYAFGHYTDVSDPTTWVTDESSVFDSGASSATTIPYEVNVPDGATHFRTTCANSSIPSLAQNFYCYLIGGNRVVDMIPQVVDNLMTDDSGEALSAKQGMRIYNALSDIDVIDFSNYDVSVQNDKYITINKYINAEGKWSQPAGDYKRYSVLVPVLDNKQVMIRANDVYNTIYAFLTSSENVSGEAASFVEQTSRYELTKGDSAVLDIPEGTVYVYLTYVSSTAEYNNGGRLPQSFEMVNPFSKVGDNIDIAENLVYMEINPFEVEKSISTTNWGWIQNSGNTLKHYQIPVCGGEHFRVVANKSYQLRYAFIVEIGSTAPTFVPGTMLVSTSNKNPIDIIVPKGTKYLYIQAGLQTPSIIQVGLNATIVRDWDARMNHNTNLPLVAYPPAVDSNGYDVVGTLQVLNALKKADQLRLVEFTPKHDIPVKSGEVIDEEVLRRSIPYSSNNDDLKIVGMQVSLHTFMTAINNPYSLIYTEQCVAENSKSAWGRTYDSPNAYCYYGTICCGLTFSVYGGDYKITNRDIGRSYRDFGDYIPLAPTGVVDWNILQVGDIVNRYTSPHSFMIYSIKRGADNNITEIKIIESTSGATSGTTGNGSGGVRVVTYNSKASFKALINGADKHTIYRYAKAYKNTQYEQSPFVTLPAYGEVQGETFVYNNEICTFAGDKASFAKGDLVVLNYNLDGNHPAQTINVYKDDTLIKPYTTSEANASYSDYASMSADGYNVIDQTNHVLVLGTELEPGKYKACIDDSTEYTYWEVLDTDVKITKVDDDTYKLQFNEEPSAVYFPCFTEHGAVDTCTVNGANEQERVTKSMILHPKSQYILSNYMNSPYDGKIRVAVKGLYGIATGAPVELEPEDE